MEAEKYASTDRSLTAPRPLSLAERSEPTWVVSATWFFVGLGIAVRLVRYFVNYPIWHDEAFLAVNFWDRGYLDLLRPLDYGQVAPWLFLAIERTAVTWLGYSEPALRLFSTICSVLSLPLLRHVAGRLLRGTPQLLAVAVLAVSFYPIRHGAEIKPYASDLLASLILLALAVEWMRSPESSRWWWALTALVPILVALSYPAVFVAGGVSLALAPSALRSNQRPVRLGCIVYNLVLVASFLAVYFACTVFQAEAMRDSYRTGCWADSFPPLDRPWAVPLWLVDVHAGRMMAYPAGERHGASSLTLLCVLAGCLALYRRNQKTTLAVLVAPFGLGLIAAFLGRYPYGGAPRIMLYGAPFDLSACGAGTDGSSLPHLPAGDAAPGVPGNPGRPGTPRRRPDGSRPGETLSSGRRRPDARLCALVLERANRPRRAGLPEDRHGALISSPSLAGRHVGCVPVSPADVL